jgi:sodium-dependent dicarboxylate transporter 2/3/5
VLAWENAHRLPWGLLLLFGGGLALGDAFAASGLSREVGSLLEGLTTWSVLPMLIAVCAIVTLLTEFTSNTATAAIRTGLVPMRAMLREGLVMDVMGVIAIAIVCWLRL